MATLESKRVQRHRKQYFDRVSCLIEKGGNALISVLAIREGVKKAEVIRRAILARAGLRMMPFPDAMKDLDAVNTQEEADAAIFRLQAHEESSEIITSLLEEYAPEPDSAKYQITVDHDTRRVLLRLAGYTDAEIAEMLKNKWGDAEQLTVSGFDVGHLRRMLANIQHIDGEES